MANKIKVKTNFFVELQIISHVLYNKIKTVSIRHTFLALSQVHYPEQLKPEKSYHSHPFCQGETYFLCSISENMLYHC